MPAGPVASDDMETTENTAFEPERHMAFDSSHPSVPATYLAGALLLTMFGLEPILIAISLAGADRKSVV